MKSLGKIVLILIGLGFIFFGLVLIFRFVFGGKEDTWICSKGQWVKHGNPTEPMPKISCQKEGQKIADVSLAENVKKVTFEESKKIAENFVLTIPTYKFDGMDLRYESSESLPCAYCWKFNFTFNSRHAGWGDRKGLNQVQVITPHKLSVTVKQGEVAVAVTDETYDEINNKYLK